MRRGLRRLATSLREQSDMTPYGSLVLISLFHSLLELHVGIIVACTPAMNQACRHLFPSYETVRSAISRYHDMRASSVVTSKKSKTNKDTLAGQIELYEGGSAESSHPTRKDLYETSMTVPARSLSSKVFQDSRTATETETSQIINGTRWYK